MSHHGSNHTHAHPHERAMVGRRGALLGVGAALALGRTSVAYAAAPTNARLVVINVRGGLDGLSAVAPYGDPDLARLRPSLVDGPVGGSGGMLDLGGSFAMHPRLLALQGMFKANEALVVHAVGNCAYTRSHFEGQDYLQSGAAQLLGNGWLNRALALLPSGAGMEAGIAMSTTMPLMIRGATPVAGWSPHSFRRPTAGLAAAMAQVLRPDRLLGPVMAAAVADRASLEGIVAAKPAAPANVPAEVALAWQAGALLAAPDGPRVATIETPPLDTHFDQRGRLDAGLASLDDMVLALKTTLGAAWRSTVVMTVTEFGRTAAANGTGGTDHGTGFAMFLAGGAVAGGRVVTSWPGLARGKLYQGRDLQPTVDVRSVVMGVLEGHMGLPASAMATVFPGASAISATGGLVRG